MATQHPAFYTTPPPVFTSVLTERGLSNNSFAQLHDEESQHVWGTVCGFKYSWKSPLELVNFEELPDWVKDNEFVKTCHRSSLPMRQAFKSIFQIHCETGNIWTHLLATMFSVWLCIYTLPQMTSALSFISMSLFFFGSTCVYACSTLYHTLYVCSPSVSRVMGKVDYVGVVCGIWGCECAVILLMFECAPTSKWSFLLIVSSLAAVCIVIVVLDSLQGPSFRVCRTLIFCLFGIFGAAPMFVYGTVNNSCFEDEACGPVMTKIFFLLGFMGFSFLGGAALYVARIPERWWPGKFDIVGHSHQIWHMTIVTGFTLHYLALSELISKRSILPSQCT